VIGEKVGAGGRGLVLGTTRVLVILHPLFWSALQRTLLPNDMVTTVDSLRLIFGTLQTTGLKGVEASLSI